jgi:hypothetical protein
MRSGSGVEEDGMTDVAKGVEVPASWIGAEALPVEFANAFVGVVGPNAVFVTIGSMVPPSIVGATVEEREAQARSIAYVPIRPIARLALAPQGLEELISTLEETRKNYKNLMNAMHNEEQA